MTQKKVAIFFIFYFIFGTLEQEEYIAQKKKNKCLEVHFLP